MGNIAKNYNNFITNNLLRLTALLAYKYLYLSTLSNRNQSVLRAKDHGSSFMNSR
ncbi:MAG: hypothetical protein KA313_08265 [Pseudarcicella sp.]|nr:hypothetical protein [Pseudarcicella sp.]